MTTFENLLQRYDYAFPPGLIAQAPASPRDSARLLVHRRKTGETEEAVFRDIGRFLPPRSVLVLNETKVIPARLQLTRSTGGRIAALWLGTANGRIQVLANRRLRPGEFLRLQGDTGFTVDGPDGRGWLLTPSFPIARLHRLLDRHGDMPLPPYIKQSPLTRAELRREYQTVFAKEAGSVAAPTASLHFTRGLLAKLQKSGIRIVRVTLHVHLGTFAPLTEEQWKTGVLHSEEYRIPPVSARVLAAARAAGDPIIAVGTTVVRTLESASDEQGRIVRPSGNTNLFIQEGYRFRLVNGLITNFHVPKSSLLMLVSAFAGRDTVLELYQRAIAAKFRFFSFGDAMLIL